MSFTLIILTFTFLFMAVAFARKAFLNFRASPRCIGNGIWLIVASLLSILMFLSLPFFESIGFGGLIIFLAVLYLILYLVLKSPVKSPEDATCANDELAGDNETSIDIIAKNVYFTVMTIMNEIIAVIIGAMLTSPLGFLTPWGFSAGGILSGAFVGWRHASKSKYLPRNALFRYLPLLAPILAVLAVAAYQNFRADNASYQHYALWVAAVSFPCVSFLVFSSF